MMKGKTNNKFQYFIVDFGSIHLIPTLCVYMALLPMIYTLAYPGSELNSLDFLAAVIAVLAVVIQIISDQQMYNFRKNLGRLLLKAAFGRDGKDKGFEVLGFIIQINWHYIASCSRSSAMAPPIAGMGLSAPRLCSKSSYRPPEAMTRFSCNAGT